VTSPLPVLPQIIVEAGFVPDSPAAPGGAMLLGTGQLGTATLGTSINWTAISPYVLSFTITRPSTRLQGPLWNYQAATASILLDNSDGRFDPDNLAGPYVSGGITQLAAMIPVRIRANFGSGGYPLYNGFADGWLPGTVTYEGGYAELTLPATDAFKVLAGITLPALSVEGIGADTGARVKDILSRAGWYTTAERNVISTGNSLLQGTTLGDTALNLMQIAADSEIGQLYVNGSGAVVFRARHDLLTDTRSNTPQAVFGDLPGTVETAGTELAYAAVGRASDDTTIGNDIQATRVGGTLQEVQNAASIAKYLFARTYARSDLILQNDSDALNWAQWVLYIAGTGEDRFETLAVDPAADPYNLWPQVLGREIGDRIQVWQRPAGLGSPITKDCFITGITHTWDSVASSWLTTWVLQDASKYGSFLTLGNATLGQLGSNALTFLSAEGTRGRTVAVPVYVTGQVLAASDCNNWFLPLAAYKTGNTIRSTTGNAADPDLVIALAASAAYDVSCSVLYSTAAAGGMTWGFTAPASPSGTFGVSYGKNGVGYTSELFTWGAATNAASPAGTQLLIEGCIFTTSAGNLTVVWASGTGGTNCTVSNGSKLMARRVG
jgi:hypothetical protein